MPTRASLPLCERKRLVWCQISSVLRRLFAVSLPHSIQCAPLRAKLPNAVLVVEVFVPSLSGLYSVLQ